MIISGKSFASILLLCCLQISPCIAEDKIVEISVVDQWEYKITKTTTYNANLCKSSTTPSQLLLQGIKSAKPLSGSPDTYYRFTLGKETFVSREDVDKRIAELTHPNFKNSLESKSCSLIRFFSCGNDLYFVHTDALMFAKEMENIKIHYFNATCNHRPGAKN